MAEDNAAALEAARREYLARLLAEDGLDTAPTRIPRRAAGARIPLTFAQEVLWLLDRATPGLIAYNSALAVRMRGAVDVAVLQSALDALIERHESLRTRFVANGDGAMQVVDPAASAALLVEDLRGGDAATLQARLDETLRAHARHAFDISREHLLRAVLARTGDDECVLLLVTHHIVSDAWSYGIMLRELSELYAAAQERRAPRLGAPSIQLGDYAAWERSTLHGERLDERLAYWRAQLLPEALTLVLPTDRPRPRVAGFEGGRALRMLPAETVERIRTLARAEGATVYMVLLAAFQTLLHRWSGQTDLVTGSAIAGRTRSETEDVVGYFSSALPLRTRFQPGDTFQSLLARVRTTVLGALEHQDVPAEALVDELRREGRAGDAPLFQAVLTMQEHQGGTLEIDGVETSPYEVISGTTKFDLTLLPAERADRLELLLWYRSDLFDPATAERFLDQFARIVHAVSADPRQPLATLSLLDDADRSVIASANATSRDLGSPTTIAALIRDAGARRGTAQAVRAGETVITWDELIGRAHQLAHRLRAAGVGPDVPVGLCFDRSVDLIVAMYGILAAGGAYVPLLPDQPAARIARQLSECGARVVVSDTTHRALLPADVTVIAIDAAADELRALPTAAPDVDVRPEHLAYVLFTSGSTGVPKGVAITHANIVHYTRAIASVLGVDLHGADAWHCATVSTLGADLGHTSVFTALASGGVLHVIAGDTAMDSARFRAYMSAHPIDLLKITPGHLAALLGGDARREHLPSRWLVLGGEACPWPLVERVRSAGSCRVLNHYGPTETTVGACTFEVTSDAASAQSASVPIGFPLPNVTARVYAPDAPSDTLVDEQPIGVPGELWIGGAGVARGYVNASRAGADRFVMRDGDRFYRTGDRVRRLPSGALEFLGRLDDQVKVRGYRVELREIESALERHPRVKHAATAVRDDQLVGYVVPSSEGLSDDTLVAHLAGELPEYMVPSVWVRLAALPLTANGKLDRGALPAPAAMAVASDEPVTETEQLLAALWREVLQKESVGIHDNFFALGGHSLLAIRLLGKVARATGVRLSLRTLFDAPSVEQLARAVDSAHAPATSQS